MLNRAATAKPNYTPSNWYWSVAGDTTKVFSSVSAGYILTADTTYVAWLAAGGRPTNIVNEAELWDVLRAQAPASLPAASLSADIMREAIKQKRDTLKESGVRVGAKWFHSDTASRVQQLGLVMMGAAMPAGIQWKTLDGSFTLMTPTLAGQIFQATAASDMTIFAVAEAHQVALAQSATPGSYDYSTGWPAGYTA